MSATAMPPQVEAKLVNLVFDVPKEGFQVGHMADVLQALNNALYKLDLQLSTTDSYLGNGDSGLFVVSTSMNSPWTLLLALVNLPERAVKAFKALVLNIAFYEQEKQRRQGVASQELAKAHRLHLSNLRKTIALARDLQAAEISPSEVRDLFEATGPLHRSPAKLIKVTEEN